MIPLIWVLLDAAILWFIISVIFKDHDLYFWMLFRWIIYASLAKLVVYFAVSKLTDGSFIANILSAVAFLITIGWLIWNYYGDRHAKKTMIAMVTYVIYSVLRLGAFYAIFSR